MSFKIICDQDTGFSSKDVEFITYKLCLKDDFLGTKVPDAVAAKFFDYDPHVLRQLNEYKNSSSLRYQIFNLSSKEANYYIIKAKTFKP